MFSLTEHLYPCYLITMTDTQIILAEQILSALNTLEEFGVREGTIDEARDEAFEYNGFTVAQYMEYLDC